MDGVGDTLRDARLRRGLELADVEEATKIRLQLLEAIEAEDWDALPGGAYSRAFVRSYANHLGLDGDRLAAACPVPLTEATPAAEEGGEIPRWAVGLAFGLALHAVIAVVGVVWDGGDDGGGSAASEATAPQGSPPQPAPEESARTPAPAQAQAGTTVSLRTTAEVWVCLLDETG
jgi:cytoskeletal protein RodZ